MEGCLRKIPSLRTCCLNGGAADLSDPELTCHAAEDSKIIENYTALLAGSSSRVMFSQLPVVVGLDTGPLWPRVR